MTAYRMTRALGYRMVLAVAGMLTLGACMSSEPVRAWQKGDLARPEMRLDDDVDARMADKAWASREAASGGARIGGGGCGCN